MYNNSYLNPEDKLSERMEYARMEVEPKVGITEIIKTEISRKKKLVQLKINNIYFPLKNA